VHTHTQCGEKIGGGANLQGKVVSAPQAEEKSNLLENRGDLEGGSG